MNEIVAMIILRKAVRLVAKIVAVILLVAVLLVAEEDIRGRLALRSEEASLRRRGEKLTLAELSLPAATANSGDVALKQAVKELSRFTQSRLASLGPGGLMHLTTPGRARVRLQNSQFPVPAALSRPPKAKAGETPADTWAEADRELAAVNGPLARVRSALAQPDTMPVVDYAKGGLSFPISGAWTANDWLRTAAACALHAHDFDVATDNIVAGLALADYLRADREMVGQTSGDTAGAVMIPLLWEALQSDGWTDAQLNRLQTQLQKAGPIAGAIESCRVELAQIPAIFSMARSSPAGRTFAMRLQGGDMIEDLVGDTEPNYPSATLVEIRSALWWAAWSHQDEARAFAGWGDLLAEIEPGRVAHTWTAFSRVPSVPKTNLPEVDRWRWSFSEMINPRLGRDVLARAVHAQGECSLAIAAIAIQRHRLRTGALPVHLNELIPAELAAVPLDPMDAQPLRYRVVAGGAFTLYSIGVNGRDDGGDATPFKGTPARSLWDGRDVVWPVRED